MSAPAFMKRLWAQPQSRGVLFVIGSVILFFGSLLLFHTPIHHDQKAERVVSLDFKKVERKQEQNLSRPKPKPKETSQKKSLRPQLNLAFQAGGLSFGLSLSDLNSGSSRLLSQSGDEVLTEDVVDRPPQVVFRTPLKYPDKALKDKVEGFVTLFLLVTKTGRVENAKLLDATPKGVFDEVALDAVRDWQFEPAEFNGNHVAVWVKQKINFKLN
ncbi:MAG: hypothetical protein CL676_01350 [Bdellovibrionaceae bacterium]|nr:hypothetical protein [Pseudobdellovibrionaceae bacterium]|tara:strand:- start:440 stop:1081 length:642 start_codon:yes stop_codon:yes gene_type:complete